MNLNTGGIPNIKIENTGNIKNPLYSVKGFIELPGWTGYFLYDDHYKLKKNKVVTNGRIDLWIDHAISPDGSFYIPQEQANSYFYLVGHEERLKQLILEELKTKFPGLLSNEYASWDHEGSFFPRLSDLTPGFDFKDYIGPESIQIGEDVRDDHAYVTWRFRCKWDPEHGLDVITHKDRIIDIAPEGDIYKIYQDNGTYDQVVEESKNKVWKLPKKKKWWQFW
jgi:hypothetical protein